MANSVWPAPDSNPVANFSRRKPVVRVAFSLLVLVLTLVLAGCGTTSVPQPILPADDGNVVLRFDPPANLAVVQPLDGTGISSTSAAACPNVESSVPFSECRYPLPAGQYKVTVTWQEHGKRQTTIVVDESEGEEYPAMTATLDPANTEEVVDEAPEDPATEPDGGETGPGGDSDAPPSDGTTEPDSGVDGDGAGDGEAGAPGDDGDSVVGPRALTLRGDPSFSSSSLTSEQKLWYDRMWAAVENPSQLPNAARLADSDDEYEFARLLYQYDHALLMGLRMTGDLRFLDEVHSIVRKMRDSLSDGWCDGVSDPYKSSYGTMQGKDGYLNFRRRIKDSPEHYCRDIHDLEEPLMHGHLAMVMYAYHSNRDLVSPSGVNYGAEADFWLDYLRNHFEAKWRERTNTSFPSMNFIKTKFCHTHNQFTLYYYFVGQRLAEDGNPDSAAYLAKARSNTDEMFDLSYKEGSRVGGFIEVPTPNGSAVIYRFGSPTQYGTSKEEACPTTYARLANEAMLELNLEGFYRWADDGIMTQLSNGLTHFVMDTNPISGREPFAGGVSGSSKVGGVEPTTYRSRLDVGQYAISVFPAMAPWDSTGEIKDISVQVHRYVEKNVDDPQRIFIPASMLVAETLGQKVR